MAWHCVLPHFSVADICAELAALKVTNTLTHLKEQHASNEVRLMSLSCSQSVHGWFNNIKKNEYICNICLYVAGFTFT